MKSAIRRISMEIEANSIVITSSLISAYWHLRFPEYLPIFEREWNIVQRLAKESWSLAILLEFAKGAIGEE